MTKCLSCSCIGIFTILFLSFNFFLIHTSSTDIRELPHCSIEVDPSSTPLLWTHSWSLRFELISSSCNANPKNTVWKHVNYSSVNTMKNVSTFMMPGVVQGGWRLRKFQVVSLLSATPPETPPLPLHSTLLKERKW